MGTGRYNDGRYDFSRCTRGAKSERVGKIRVFGGGKRWTYKGEDGGENHGTIEYDDRGYASFRDQQGEEVARSKRGADQSEIDFDEKDRKGQQGRLRRLRN